MPAHERLVFGEDGVGKERVPRTVFEVNRIIGALCRAAVCNGILIFLCPRFVCADVVDGDGICILVFSRRRDGKLNFVFRRCREHNLIAGGVANRIAPFGKSSARNLSVVVIERQYDHQIALVHGSSQAPFVARRIRLLHHIFWSDVRSHHIAVEGTVDRRRKERFEFGGVGKAFPGNGSDIIVVDVRLHRELVCTADRNANVVLVDLGSEVVALVGEVVARLFEQPEALLVLPNALIHTARLFVVTEHAELEHVSFVQIDGKGKGVKLPFDRFKIVLVGV